MVEAVVCVGPAHFALTHFTLVRQLAVVTPRGIEPEGRSRSHRLVAAKGLVVTEAEADRGSAICACPRCRHVITGVAMAVAKGCSAVCVLVPARRDAVVARVQRVRVAGVRSVFVRVCMSGYEGLKLAEEYSMHACLHAPVYV
jgi:hypothetical protein